MSVMQLRAIAQTLRTTPAELLAQTDTYALTFQRQGGELIKEKQESSAAPLLFALASLAAILAASSK